MDTPLYIPYSPRGHNQHIPYSPHGPPSLIPYSSSQTPTRSSPVALHGMPSLTPHGHPPIPLHSPCLYSPMDTLPTCSAVPWAHRPHPHPPRPSPWLYQLCPCSAPSCPHQRSHDLNHSTIPLLDLMVSVSSCNLNPTMSQSQFGATHPIPCPGPIPAQAMGCLEGAGRGQDPPGCGCCPNQPR